MKILKPYLAIDIETTGLDTNKSHILQLSCIYDDGISNINDLKALDLRIKQELHYTEPFAMQMNAILLAEIETEIYPVVSLNEAHEELLNFINTLKFEKKLTVAGKNVAGFDIPLLKSNKFSTSAFSHRVIDPGSLYLPDFGYVPNLTEINKLNGRSEASHKALDDCYDVVTAIRSKMGIK